MEEGRYEYGLVEGICRVGESSQAPAEGRNKKEIITDKIIIIVLFFNLNLNLKIKKPDCLLYFGSPAIVQTKDP